MALEIRSVGPESAAVLLRVVRAAFEARPELDPPAEALAETEASMAALLTTRGGLLAVLHGEPVGGVVLDPDGDTLFLRRFGVIPGAQGHGIAGALVHAALDASRDFRRIAVLAREELPATVGFWRNQGFEETDRHPPYVDLGRAVPQVFDVPDADDMRDLARRLAAQLRAGDLLVLTGDLGSGKTTFTQGLGEGLGVRGAVTSPTFVIARVHPAQGEGPDLVHVDAYRLGGVAELDDLDLDTSLEDAVTVVEWGEGLAEGLADSRLEIRIGRTPGLTHDGDDVRRVEMLAVGPRWAGFGGPAPAAPVGGH